MTAPEAPFHRAALAWLGVALGAEAFHAATTPPAGRDAAQRLVLFGAALVLFALGQATRLLRQRLVELSSIGLDASWALLNTGLIAWAVSSAAGSGSLATLATLVLLMAAAAFGAAGSHRQRPRLVTSDGAALSGASHDPSTR